jgi:hypothetical protein
MKRSTHVFARVLVGITMSGEASAQALNGLLFPSKPSSADSLKLSIRDRTCSGQEPYVANPYRISMSNNNVTVTLGQRTPGLVGLCPPPAREEIDLGRLPAGDYTLTVDEGPQTTQGSPLFISNVPFTVTDARATKAAPYVRLDYSGAWWDPNDSGWGLFIWQDARGPNDSLLAAWFSYTPDGKPMWYTFQPKWQTSTATVEASLLQASRPPGATSPPPGITSSVTVGTASLDFTNFSTADEGKLTYTFNNGTKLVRTIQRLRP